MITYVPNGFLQPFNDAAPPLTPELRQSMVAGCEREAADWSVDQLERRRDEFLAELLTLLERFSLDHVADPGPPLPAAQFTAAGPIQSDVSAPASWAD